MDHHRRLLLRAAATAPLAALATGCAGNGDDDVLVWNEALVAAIRKGTLGPPMAARAIAIVHTAIYDAWAPFDATAVATLAGGPSRVDASIADTASKRTAIAYAAYRALLDLFPAESATLAALMSSRGLSPNDESLDERTPVGIGNAAAARLLADRHADGSNQLGNLAPGAYADYTGYTPVNTVDTLANPERWQPLRFDNGKTPGFMAPHWGQVRPFGLSAGDALRPYVTLPRWGSAQYRDQADYVVGLTAALDDRTKTIAEYWANGPGSELPPGHWCLFAQWVSARDRHSLDDDVRMFFILGNAVMDAGIVCWDAKRFYDSVRPISAIRALYPTDQVIGFLGPDLGIGPMPGATWRPYQPGTFITPPFAEFMSGHSTFSAAGAEVLARFSGSDRCGWSYAAAPGSSTHQRGVPAAEVTLSWETFTAAADEAGVSRLLGGIHFAAANVYGQAAGRRVAAAAWDRANRLFVGSRS